MEAPLRPEDGASGSNTDEQGLVSREKQEFAGRDGGAGFPVKVHSPRREEDACGPAGLH